MEIEKGKEEGREGAGQAKGKGKGQTMPPCPMPHINNATAPVSTPTPTPLPPLLFSHPSSSVWENATNCKVAYKARGYKGGPQYGVGWEGGSKDRQ